MKEQAKPTLEQMIGFAQRSSDDAWLNSNTHTAEMFAAIANALREATPTAQPAALGGLADLLSELRQHIQHRWTADPEKIEDWYERLATACASGS